MKNFVLAAGAFVLLATYAHPAKAGSDTSRGILGATVPASGVTMKMVDTDPFQMRVAGVTCPMSAVTMRIVDTDPFQMRVPGVMFSASAVTMRIVDTDPFQMRTPGVRFATSQDTRLSATASDGRTGPAFHDFARYLP